MPEVGLSGASSRARAPALALLFSTEFRNFSGAKGGVDQRVMHAVVAGETAREPLAANQDYISILFVMPSVRGAVDARAGNILPGEGHG